MSTLAVVIPAAPDSPWLAGCLAALGPERPAAVYVVADAVPAGVERHVPVARHLGFAARANAGLARAHGDGHRRALLLNDDTELRPGALAALEACEGAVVGAVLEHWEGGVQQAGLRLDPRTARVRALTQEAPDIRAVDAIGGAAIVLDLDWWQRLGGFDEAFGFYFEDVDLCVRVRAAGGEVLLVPEARVRHHGGGTRSHQSAGAAWHLGYSHVLLARKLGGGAARMAAVGGAGLAWSLRSVGPGGVRAFVRGYLQGVSYSRPR